MTQDIKYIHGTDADEQLRLLLLNSLTNQSFIEFLNLQGHEKVLELGSGLGVLTAKVAQKLRTGHVTGIELSKEQLSKTPSVPENLEFVLGDVHDLPFDNNSFDIVYDRYLLEHVQNPNQVLSESYRILKSGGKIYLQENSSLWMEFYPAVPAFRHVWKKFIQLQSLLGGDGMIGIKLFDRLKKTDFRNIKISLAPEIHSADDRTFVPWIQNLIGNLAGAKNELIAKNMITIEEYTHAVQEMTDFSKNQHASSYFAWNRAEANK